jgi:hypothetical protein
MGILTKQKKRAPTLKLPCQVAKFMDPSLTTTTRIRDTRTGIVQRELHYTVIHIHWRLGAIGVLGVLWHVQWFWATLPYFGVSSRRILRIVMLRKQRISKSISKNTGCQHPPDISSPAANGLSKSPS